MSKDFKITGLKEINDALAALPEKIQKNIVRTALRRGIKHYNRIARGNFRTRTGKLAASLQARTKILKSGRVEARGGFLTRSGKGKGKVYYAHFVEFGTQPHVIRARRGKGLGFLGLKKVNHPGSRAFKPITKAFTTGTSGAIQAATAYMRKKLKMPKGADIPDMETDE